MDIDEITGCIVDAAYKVHTGLGPGLLESIYEAVLARDLEKRGLVVERQKVVSFEFDGMRFDEGLQRIVNNYKPSTAFHIHPQDLNK